MRGVSRGDSSRGVGFDGLAGAVSRWDLACGWGKKRAAWGAPVSSPSALRRGRDFLGIGCWGLRYYLGVGHANAIKFSSEKGLGSQAPASGVS